MKIKNKKILIIGAGFFAQRVHIPTVKKFFTEKNIFLYDERLVLAKLVAKKFKINQFFSISEKNLIKNKITLGLICYKRERSFYYSKKLLNYNLNLLCEKPAVLDHKNLKYLINLSNKKNKIFQVCYQKNYFNSVIFLKKNISKLIKQYGKINQINFELFNGDMRFGKKSFCRTNEKIKDKEIEENNLKNVSNKNLIKYKIFSNRYIHSINLFHNLFPFLSKPKKINFEIITKFNYYLSFLLSNINVSFFFGDYSYNLWHDRIIIIFQKAKVSLDMIAPLDFKNKSKITIYDGIKKKNIMIRLKKNNVFQDQFKSFIHNTKIKNKKTQFNIYLKDYNLLKDIWKK